MKKIILILALVMSCSNTEINTVKFDFFNNGLKYLFSSQYLQSYYEFNFILTHFPNYYSNYKTNYYVAANLLYFGHVEEALRYLDSSDSHKGISRDSNPDPFVWLVRGDTTKAIACFKNVDKYPFEYAFYKYYVHDPDLVKFICLINPEAYNEKNAKAYVTLSGTFRADNKSKESLLISPLVSKAFDAIVKINNDASQNPGFEITGLNDVMALFIAKALYYKELEDYDRCEIYLHKIVLCFPYLFKANPTRLPGNIMSEMMYQRNRISQRNPFKPNKPLEELINMKQIEFNKLNDISFADNSVDRMYRNLLILINDYANDRKVEFPAEQRRHGRE